MDRIILGDCLIELRKLKDNSVDAVVTDPPYELGFMGKSWDNTGIAYRKDLWLEVLRVLKPGGHLLSFGGSRTYHRMACAIEDAGFEIRDQIMWVYGCLSEDTEILTINGWERYHKTIDNNPVLCYNIDNNSYEFHKPKRSFIYENKHTAYQIHSDNTDQIVSRNHRVLIERGGKLSFTLAEELAREQEANIPFLESLSDLPETIYNAYEGTSITKSVLLKRVFKQENIASEEGKIQKTRKNLSTMWKAFQTEMGRLQERNSLLSALCFKKSSLVKALFSKRQRNKKSQEISLRVKQPCLERWSNIFSQARELLADKICKMSERILGYGSQGRLCYGTQAHNGSISQSVFTKNRGCSSYQPQPAGQSDRKSAIISDEQSPQNPRRTRAEVTPVEYKGNVWCVEVETGAFIARRNGKIFITGNSGFPKSLNIGKAVDKLQGNEREVVGDNDNARTNLPDKDIYEAGIRGKECSITKGSSDWEGYGTALKPAHEPIVLARKPLSEKTVAENCLKWGVGGLAIDECRVGTDTHKVNINDFTNQHGNKFGNNMPIAKLGEREVTGRFPSNFIHDGSQEVLELFPNSKSTGGINGGKLGNNVFGKFANETIGANAGGLGDSGSAARFFYCAKASKRERDMGCEGLELKDGGCLDGNSDMSNNRKIGARPDIKVSLVRNNHPTVKPLALMKYLVKLVSREGQTVLDPFMGSGTTGIACKELNREFIGIEKLPEYVEIAEKRIGALEEVLV